MPQLREGEMQDPSLDTKKELTETGEDVVEEFGKMMKLLLKGASISEDLNAVIKSFAVHEQNIAKTDGIVRQLSLVTQEMDISRARLLKSFHSTERVVSQIEDIKAMVQLPPMDEVPRT
eukprot:TRINITY_DN1448_c0_g1_i3.p1 TRINITY_DN1448_c0_g1~~TRINITY_DN1448_c0_g1_i3.p1  ORF type:complete len:119 (-),score=29.94 TRINITY_DN1448_c0_g1_i3:279-635(-)